MKLNGLFESRLKDSLSELNTVYARFVSLKVGFTVAIDDGIRAEIFILYPYPTQIDRPKMSKLNGPYELPYFYLIIPGL